MLSEHTNARIDVAVRKGMEAFMVTVSGEFPEIVTGDFPCDAQARLVDALTEATRIWVAGNAPIEPEAEEVSRYAIVVWHGEGEGETLYFVVDTEAPEAEQPAVVAQSRSLGQAIGAALSLEMLGGVQC